MLRWLKRGFASVATVGLVLALAYLAGNGGASGHRLSGPTAIRVTAYPIPFFKQGEPGLKRFGPLEYMGGLELRGAHPNFGGISAIRVQADGEGFLGITDTGDWISGKLTYLDGILAGVRDVSLAPVLGLGGKQAKDLGLWDIESLALTAGKVFVGIERDHSVLAFSTAKGGLQASGQHVPVPSFVKDWPNNRGIEALGILPPQSPYAGHLIGISERSGGADQPTQGFVMREDGSEPFAFSLARSDGFDVTDLDFLPSGDLIILERYFSPVRGVALRIRRAKLSDIKPNANVQAQTLLTADRTFQIDNMEGISIHRNARGETVFTLVSDDNFSVAQRTLLLQFRWLGD
jgi:hypothetical protein